MMKPRRAGRCRGWWLAVVLLTAACSEKPNVPWSLEGVEVPAHRIVNREDMSMPGSVTYTVSAVVAGDITRDGLTQVSQRIIERLPKHNLALIFYYTDEKDARDGGKPFTVGKVWWGIEDDTFPPPGDYSHNVLRLEMAK